VNGDCNPPRTDRLVISACVIVRLYYPEVGHQIQRIKFDGPGGMEYSFVMSAEEAAKNWVTHVGKRIHGLQAERSPVCLFRLGPAPLKQSRHSQRAVQHHGTLIES
jgi:hypothetical protein